MSPLLFILVLETLLRKIRTDEEIKVITIGTRSYKLKAFADDLVLTVENPLESVPKVLEKLNEFGQVAGFKLNKGKSKMLVKNMTEQNKNELEQITELKIKK